MALSKIALLLALAAGGDAFSQNDLQKIQIQIVL